MGFNVHMSPTFKMIPMCRYASQATQKAGDNYGRIVKMNMRVKYESPISYGSKVIPRLKLLASRSYFKVQDLVGRKYGTYRKV